jgi:transposase
VAIGGAQTKVHLCVLTLGYSRRQLIRVFRQQQQRHWLQALEEAFRCWRGIPEQVLVDNAKALITLNNPRTGELVVNPTFAAFARHWGFTVKACWPHRPQTKGKDERGVGYVKRSGVAGHWAGLVPQRAIETAHQFKSTAVVELDAVLRSSLTRALSDYAAVLAEVG